MQPTYPRLLKDRDKYRRWYLDEPVTVQLSDGHRLDIPKGYRFDAHSVPFVFRLLFPKYNTRDVYASMVHDCLVDIEMFHRFNLTRTDWDALTINAIISSPITFSTTYSEASVTSLPWLKNTHQLRG